MNNFERVSLSIEAASLDKYSTAYLLQDMVDAMKSEGPAQCIGANETFQLDVNTTGEAVDSPRGKIDGYNYHRLHIEYKGTQLEPHHYELARTALSFLIPRHGSTYEVSEVRELPQPRPDTFTSHAVFWETIDDEALRIAAFEEHGYAEMPQRERTLTRMLLYEGLGHSRRMLRPGRSLLCDVMVDEIN
jgi:hypothetical protein